MFNHTISSLPAYQGSQSAMSILNFAISLMWGAGELILSMGFITAFSFIVCYGFGAILEPKEKEVDGHNSEAASKENTAAIFMSAMLNGFHVTFVFFGLPLFGHAADPFLLRLLYSSAIIAALTTGVTIGTIIVYLTIPAIRSCCKRVVRLVRKSPAEKDIEAQVERQTLIVACEKK